MANAEIDTDYAKVKKEKNMANDNETVEHVALSDRPLAEQLRIIRGNYSIGSGEFDALDEAADVVECHQRDIAEKDAEIEDLKKENASLRVIVSGATVADGNLREEIERLREIVKELADELETMICNEIVKSSKRHGK